MRMVKLNIMVEKIKRLIANYITQNSDIKSWEEIRVLYSVYTYIAFLTIAIKSTTGKHDYIRDRAISLGLESKENLEYIFNYPGTERLVEEVADLMEDKEQIDIDALYQAFLSIDFVVSDNSVSFSGGKNCRDTLGSYYTQEDFAYEIAKKTIEEYMSNFTNKPSEISVADFSCGGGVFLVAAKKICEEKKIRVKLLGIDVDPIATMIAKARLVLEQVDEKDMHIFLGNPLLKNINKDNSHEAFVMSLKGRYYNSCLGIDIDENYDVVIGNPPWEKIRFEEKKFLSHYVSSEQTNTKKDRENVVNCTSDENKEFYSVLTRDYESAKVEIKNNKKFIGTRNGELNTYALFAEYALNHMSDKGTVGLIVKSSLLKVPVYSEFMKHSMVSKKLYEVYMFVNRKKIFNIDSREEFSVIFYKNKNKEDLRMAVNLEEYKSFYKKDKIEISYSTLKLLNPETSMLPNITSNDELKFLCNIYSNNPIFGKRYKECHFGRLVHLTNHSKYILRENKEGYLPIYEGKFIELYTGKYATFNGMSEYNKYKSKATARAIDNISGDEYPESRFYIKSEVWNNLSKNFHNEYIIAWRSLTSATNHRTMLATVLPFTPTCQSIQLLQMNELEEMLQILALFNSIIFDYIVRLKMAGLDLTQTIIKQIPVPREDSFGKYIVFQEKEDSLRNHIISRLRFLYKDDIRVSCLFDKSENYEIINKPRKQVIAELDCLVGYLYSLTTEEIKKIAKTFDKYYSTEEVEQWF